MFCGTIPQKGECVGPNLFIEVVMWILTCCTAGLSCGSKEKRFCAVKPVKSELIFLVVKKQMNISNAPADQKGN